MSRIGKKEIIVPSDVKVDIQDRTVTVSGPKGTLTLKVYPGIEVQLNDGKMLVTKKKESKLLQALHGTTRQLIDNMVTGVTKGWAKTLEVIGTGYRAVLDGNKLVLSLGFSHKIEIEPPEGISFSVAENKITVSSIDKSDVGQMAAKIRGLRPPDPYKGKGIRYKGEKIKLKPGKAAKVGGGK